MALHYVDPKVHFNNMASKQLESFNNFNVSTAGKLFMFWIFIFQTCFSSGEDHGAANTGTELPQEFLAISDSLADSTPSKVRDIVTPLGP